MPPKIENSKDDKSAKKGMHDEVRSWLAGEKIAALASLKTIPGIDSGINVARRNALNARIEWITAQLANG